MNDQQQATFGQIIIAVIVVAIIGAVVWHAVKPAANLHGAPNVRGMSLPDARTQLEAGGFTASVTTDALFGVVVESHYTVCSESSPNGKLVPIKVNKDC